MISIANRFDNYDTSQKISINAISSISLRGNFPTISAKQNIGVDELKNQLLSFVNTGAFRNNETNVTDTRHYDSLLKALAEIQNVKYGLETNLCSYLMAIDSKEALYHFEMITGKLQTMNCCGISLPTFVSESKYHKNKQI